jgi:hypothetical protein
MGCSRGAKPFFSLMCWVGWDNIELSHNIPA